jgi:hypothetical protein
MLIISTFSLMVVSQEDVENLGTVSEDVYETYF